MGLAHLYSFTVADGTEITPLDLWDGEAREGSLDREKTKLSRLAAGEQFAFLFDFGDDWSHLCTVAVDRIDPIDTLGLLELPTEPLPYYGWGDLPDQYGRRCVAEDGGSAVPDRLARPLAELALSLPWRGHANEAISPNFSMIFQFV
ncbi:plasmid pRiA4b ORF-3 family protein [Phytohabitans suffuscus]|uniref:hypothetical protein n=1 Tax=Phytohabitans suffuscus TaxID=624315 RepID=UPI0018DA1066|nr:hypothetical protein [Phytohabitans suffuscus]